MEAALGKRLTGYRDSTGTKYPGLKEAAGGSLYGNYHGLKIRVSDHPAVAGGGFNQGTGERMGDPDVEFVAAKDGEVEMDRKKIREKILDAMRLNGITTHAQPTLNFRPSVRRSLPTVNRKRRFTLNAGPRSLSYV